MLDFLGTVATAALIVFVISTLLVYLEVSRETKIIMAALLGPWVGIAAADVDGPARDRLGVAAAGVKQIRSGPSHTTSP